MGKRAMVVLYFALASVLGVVLGWTGLPLYWRLLNAGQATHATVSRTTCENHGTISYQFVAGGREYSGWGSAGFGMLDCGELKAGDTILVYYLPSDPAVSRPGSIRDRWWNEVISITLAVATLPALVVWTVWWRLPDRYRASA